MIYFTHFTSVLQYFQCMGIFIFCRYMPQKEKEQLTHATEILKKCEDLDDMEKAKKIQQEVVFFSFM